MKQQDKGRRELRPNCMFPPAPVLPGLWVTWHVSRRSRSLAATFRLSIYEHANEGGLIGRHIVNSFRSFSCLLLRRPRVIFLQYSFLLLVVVVLYRLLYFGRVVVVCDCHTKALRRHMTGFIGRLFWAVKRWSFKHTDISIVSNEGMIADIEVLTDSYCVLPDPCPLISPNPEITEEPTLCVYVNSFAIDEPHEEVLSAAAKLSDRFRFVFTNEVPPKFLANRAVPANVEFSGWLPDEAYFQLLTRAGSVIALTTEDECLQCGAYEALALGTPMVLSDTTALRNHFQSAAIYVKNDSESIQEGIERALRSREKLKAAGAQVKLLHDMDFKCRSMALLESVKRFLEQVPKQNGDINESA